MFSFTSLIRPAKRALHHRGPRPQIIAIGSVLIVGSMLTYQVVVNSSRFGAEGSIVRLQILAVANLAVLIGGLAMVLLGVTSYLRCSNSTKTQFAPASLLSIVWSERSTRRLFAISSVAYGVLFGFMSGTLVFRAGSFSETYGVSVPSAVTVICCGSLGQIPQLVVYVTQQFAILIIPVNLILLVTISWLVGLNVAVTRYSYKNRSSSLRNHWFGGLGAIVGVFSACPTCAGFFFLTMLGLTGAVTFAIMLSSLQMVFAGAGLPLLLLTPTLAARKMPKDWITSCRFFWRQKDR